jgi:hypothetical protein
MYAGWIKIIGRAFLAPSTRQGTTTLHPVQLARLSRHQANAMHRKTSTTHTRRGLQSLISPLTSEYRLVDGLACRFRQWHGHVPIPDNCVAAYRE